MALASTFSKHNVGKHPIPLRECRHKVACRQVRIGLGYLKFQDQRKLDCQMTRTLLAAAFLTAATALGTAQTATADVHFANCTEARSAGATPLYEGDPGYAPHLDRDRDGTACE